MMQTQEICHVGRCPRGCVEVCKRATEITDVAQAARHHRLNADMTSAEIAFKAGAEWMAARRKLLARQVPDGWVAVPRVPTQDMITAGGQAPGMTAIDGVLGLHQARSGCLPQWPGEGSPLEQAYVAMLAAAPAAAAAGAEEEKHG